MRRRSARRRPGGDDFDQAICFMVPGRLSHAVGQGFSSPPSAVNGCPAGSTGEAFSSRLRRFSSGAWGPQVAPHAGGHCEEMLRGAIEEDQPGREVPRPDP